MNYPSINYQDELMKKYLKTGTTTVGIVVRNGVILAADKRATAGYYVAHKHVKKILFINDRIAITTAGLVADAQMLVDIVKNEMKYYQLSTGMPVKVKIVASMLSNILHSYRFYPFIVQLLVGGYDDNPHLYMLEFFGAVAKEKYAATGSGSPIAIGVIEKNYREDMSIDEAKKLAIDAVNAAMMRDTATGEGIDVAVITKDYSKIETIKYRG